MELPPGKLGKIILSLGFYPARIKKYGREKNISLGVELTYERGGERERISRRCARMSEKNPLDFALREDEEALKKGRDFSLSLPFFPAPSFMNASRRRTQTITGEAQNKMRSHYAHLR